MKELLLDDELIVAGGIRHAEDVCPEGMHLCITVPQGEPPCCD